MENREYIEYMDDEEEDDKIRIKSGKMGNEYFEEDEQIKSEYFESNLKTEIQETAQKSVNISCDICQKIFKTKDNLKNHYQSVHKSIKYPCDQCCKQFTRKDHLKTHIQSVH